MKIAVQILSAYMFALSFVPCGDGGNGLAEILADRQELVLSSTTDHHQHSNDCGDDDCSPFCICTCCSTALFPVGKAPLLSAAPLVAPGSTPIFEEAVHSNIYRHAIWQPPRV